MKKTNNGASEFVCEVDKWNKKFGRSVVLVPGFVGEVAKWKNKKFG